MKSQHIALVWLAGIVVGWTLVFCLVYAVMYSIDVMSVILEAMV